MNEFWGWFGGQWGNFVGAAGLITGVIFYWLSRKPKRFGWQLISSTSIVSRVGKSLPLSVVYDGQDVDSPNVVIIRTGNLGKAELRAHDFDGPVRIQFQKSRLLAASITDTSATDIAPELNQTEMNSISFTPSLLNAGEWINLQFVTDGPLEAPRILARVAGQTGSMVDLKEQRQKVWLPVVLVGFAAVLFVPWITFLNRSLAPIGIISAAIGFCAIIIGFIGMDRRMAWARKSGARRPRRNEK